MSPFKWGNNFRSSIALFPLVLRRKSIIYIYFLFFLNIFFNSDFLLISHTLQINPTSIYYSFPPPPPPVEISEKFTGGGGGGGHTHDQHTRTHKHTHAHTLTCTHVNTHTQTHTHVRTHINPHTQTGLFMYSISPL